jgi:MFS family permease
MNRKIASEVRATALSLASMAGSLAFVLLSPVFGQIVDAFSLRAAYFGLAGLFLGGAFILLAILLKPQPDAA